MGDEEDQMMQIQAVFHRCVFEPLEPVSLAEGQRVMLTIEPAEKVDPKMALERIHAIRAQINAREGMLPDSTPGIAEDRMR
jgi:predicted DNA-binding antitoxin AbrB/MazE fold protein